MPGQGFFSSLDTLVATVMRLDDLRHASLLGLFGKRVASAGDEKTGGSDG